MGFYGQVTDYIPSLGFEFNILPLFQNKGLLNFTTILFSFCDNNWRRHVKNHFPSSSFAPVDIQTLQLSTIRCFFNATAQCSLATNIDTSS
mmetsp:Transcript_25296/g.37352  ORF Transcript_25296/g.37352 Transcript_25296/m.37352 type:complete len:91 (-) Transcript_25296:476-748(-)